MMVLQCRVILHLLDLRLPVIDIEVSSMFIDIEVSSMFIDIEVSSMLIDIEVSSMSMLPVYSVVIFSGICRFI